MKFLIAVAAPVFVIVSIVLFIVDGIFAKKEERNRHKIFTNMFTISIGIICLCIGFVLGSVMIISFIDPRAGIGMTALAIISIINFRAEIGIGIALFAIISIILFIRDGILAKKEERRRDKIFTQNRYVQFIEEK